MADVVLLDYHQVAMRLGVSHGTIAKWVVGIRNAPKNFPKPVPLGGKLKRIRSDHFDAWINNLGTGDENIALSDVVQKRGPGRPRKIAVTKNK
ncbi:helix-turn-helix transcriptional regulator [Denitratisoma oestradiolicum]|nr:hypothetical protein [Denitratisoma oestradiolicum]